MPPAASQSLVKRTWSVGARAEPASALELHGDRLGQAGLDRQPVVPPEVLVAGWPLDRLDDPGAVEGGKQHPLVAELDVVVGPLELLEPLLAEAQDELAAGGPGRVREETTNGTDQLGDFLGR